jgi:hypothetical protein
MAHAMKGGWRSTGWLLTVCMLLILPLFLKVTRTGITLGDALVSKGGGQTFPLSLPVASVLFAYVFVAHRKASLSSGLFPVIAVFWVLNIVAMLLGLRSTPRIENVLFCIQTVLPTVAFFVGRSLFNTESRVRSLFVTWTSALGVFVGALLVYSILAQGVSYTLRNGLSPSLGPIPIYNLFDYVPVVISVVYGLGLAWVIGEVRDGRRRVLLYSLVTVLFSSVFLLRSKGGVLTVLAIMVACVGSYIVLRSHQLRAIGLAVPHAAIAVCLLVATPSVTGTNMASMGQFLAAQVGQSADRIPPSSPAVRPTQPQIPAVVPDSTVANGSPASAAGTQAGPATPLPADTKSRRVAPAPRARAQRAESAPHARAERVESAPRAAEAPSNVKAPSNAVVVERPAPSIAETSGTKDRSMISRMHNIRTSIATIRRDPFFGERYQARTVDWDKIYRIANPHNQYLTYAVRGGLPSLFAFLVILGWTMVHVVRICFAPANPLIQLLAIGLLSAFAGAAGISNLLQDNFIQPYTAVVLWLLMGITESLAARNRALLEKRTSA